MTRLILIDEFHVFLKIPRGLNPKSGQAIRRILNGRRFQAALRGAVTSAIRRFEGLRDVRGTISR